MQNAMMSETALFSVIRASGAVHGESAGSREGGPDWASVFAALEAEAVQIAQPAGLRGQVPAGEGAEAPATEASAEVDAGPIAADLAETVVAEGAAAEPEVATGEMEVATDPDAGGDVKEPLDLLLDVVAVPVPAAQRDLPAPTVLVSAAEGIEAPRETVADQPEDGARPEAAPPSGGLTAPPAAAAEVAAPGAGPLARGLSVEDIAERPGRLAASVVPGAAAPQHRHPAFAPHVPAPATTATATEGLEALRARPVAAPPVAAPGADADSATPPAAPGVASERSGVSGELTGRIEARWETHRGAVPNGSAGEKPESPPQREVLRAPTVPTAAAGLRAGIEETAANDGAGDTSEATTEAAAPQHRSGSTPAAVQQGAAPITTSAPSFGAIPAVSDGPSVMSALAVENVAAVPDLRGTGPSGATAQHITGPAPQPALSQQVAAQIAEISRPLPDGPVELSLHPEELGRLKLSFSGGEAGLHVVVAAERPETLDMLRRHIDVLAQEMRRLGHENAQFSFAGGHSFGQGQRDPGTGSTQSVSWAGDGPGTGPAVDPTAPRRPALRLGTAGLDLRL